MGAARVRYTPITMIMRSRWKSGGCARYTTIGGTPNTEKRRMATDQPNDLPIQLKDCWGVTMTEVPAHGHGLIMLWNKKQRLHAVAIYDIELNPADREHVPVPVDRWISLRNAADRMHVPSVVFIRTATDEYWFASWAVSSGISYNPSPWGGGTIPVLKNEFKRLAKPVKK
jgi:hypothetical protein